MKLKSLIFTLFSIVLFILLFIGSLPTLLSTEPGKKIILSLLQKRGYKNISAKAFDLHWQGPQKIEGLEIHTDSLHFASEIFQTDMNFISLLNLSKLDNQSIVSLKTKVLLKNASLKINYPNTVPISLFDINGQIFTNGGDNPIEILLSGKSSMNEQIGNFDISSSVSHSGNIGTITLKNFPTISLDELVFRDSNENKGIITQILGPKTNLTSAFKIVNYEGTIFVDISSSNVKSIISAYYANDTVTLTAPLYASVILSEKLCQTIIKDVNPLLIYGLKSYTPVKIIISEKGFSLPVHPFSLTDLKIDNAQIDFGKIRTKNGNNLSLIIGIMKYHSLEDVQEMNIWCTPVNIKISNGKLFASRMDALLADEIHICTWGAIDLATKKIKMTLGLTAQALERGFGIKDMPSDYVMKIPMKGTSENLKINKGQAIAKIGSLLALQSTEKKSIFGQILESIKQSGEDQSDVPPPLIPFPWGNY